MAIEVVGYNSPDGVTVGNATSQPISFYGVTPAVTQQTSASQAVVSTTAIAAVATTASVSTTPFGFTTSTQANAIVTAVNLLVSQAAANSYLANSLQQALVNLGLIKGS